MEHKIKKAIKNGTKKKKTPQGVRLNLGCGIHLAGGFLNIDKFVDEVALRRDVKTKKGFYANGTVEPNAKFLQADVLALPLIGNFADYIETTDMIEHLPFREIPLALKEMYRVLKPGGEIRIETVNFNALVDQWAREVAALEDKMNYDDPTCMYYDLQEVVFGNQIGNGEFHRAALTPRYMHYLMTRVGFKDIQFQIYPVGCPTQPEMYAQRKWPKGAVIRAEEFIAIATK